MSAEPEVLFTRHGVAGVITLNRPKALNAVTANMVRLMAPQLARWASDPAIERVIIKGAGDKAFSAGGDIRQLYEWGQSRDPAYHDFFRKEYTLDTVIKRYPKPYVALIDGIAMGGGVGVSFNGSHRVASENMTFAMPETGIGFFPDVGGTYFLPRCPGRTGLYLGLTGARIKTADAVWCGLATAHVPRSRFGALQDALCEPGDTNAIIAGFASDPGDAPIAARQADISRHFGQDSLEMIMASLAADPGDWARKTLETLRTKSPTSLAITFRQLVAGATQSFEDCMRLEFRIVTRIFDGHDFFEGTRAVIIDKDQAPHWRPATLDEVDAASIERYFAPLAEELPLPVH